MVCDLSKEASARELVSTCCDSFGSGIDFMFANAGVGGSMTPLLDQDTEEWETVMRINVLGVFYCIKHAAARYGAAAECPARGAAERSDAPH